MCLIADSKEYKIAEEDIVCYKALHYVEDADIYTTPFVRAWVASSSKIIGYKHQAGGILEKVLERYYNQIHGYDAYLKFRVTSGFIHVYKNIADVQDFPEWLTVFKCIIPKGTVYFEGKFTTTEDGAEVNYASYASREIVYQEEITSWRLHFQD